MSNIKYGPQPPVGPDVKAEQRLVDAVSPSVHIKLYDRRRVEIGVENEGKTHTFIVPRAPLITPEVRASLQEE